MVSALGASWGSLGTFLAHLVGLLVAPGASLGASWDLLGLLGRRLVALGASCMLLGGVLGRELFEPLGREPVEPLGREPVEPLGREPVEPLGRDLEPRE